MARAPLTAITAAAVLLATGAATAGEDYTFTQKLFMADAIVRVSMTFDRPIPANWPNKTCDRLKWAFPLALAQRAARTAKIKEVLRGPHDGKLPELFGSSIDDCWWWEVHRQGNAEVVLFLKKTPQGWTEIRGVEGPTAASPDNLASTRRILRWLAQPRAARIAAAKKQLRSGREPYVSAAFATLCLDAPESPPTSECTDFLASLTAWSRIPVAITIDDLPAHGPLPPGVDRASLAERIIDVLRRHGLKGVYGFVNGKAVDDDPATEAVLQKWLAAGYQLGNHTYSHINLNKVTLDAYFGDIEKGEGILKRLVPEPSAWKVFRYPFLFEGDTDEKRTAVRAHLVQRGYRTAEVTIDAADWAFNPPFVRCAQRHDEAGLAELRRTFVSVHRDELVRVRRVTRDLVDRDVPHVLLLHLGAADADAMDDLLTAFEGAGVSWTSLETVLGDPFYRLDPAAPSPNGLAFPYLLARARGLTVPPSPAQAVSQRLSALCQ